MYHRSTPPSSRNHALCQNAPRNRPVTTENYRREPRVSISYQPVPNDIEKPPATRYRWEKIKSVVFFEISRAPILENLDHRSEREREREKLDRSHPWLVGLSNTSVEVRFWRTALLLLSFRPPSSFSATLILSSSRVHRTVLMRCPRAWTCPLARKWNF